MELIQAISQKDFNLDQFVQLAIGDEKIRDEIVQLMITHPDIMVYYHSFYVVNQASQEMPELFYKYWDDIAALLFHINSYHRDFALTILANLSIIDDKNLFSMICTEYFSHINDEKFMTACCCVKNTLKILENKTELRDYILDVMLGVDMRCSFPEKQLALLKCDILNVFERVLGVVGGDKKNRIGTFIQAQTNSVSPKTRCKAQELLTKI